MDWVLVTFDDYTPNGQWHNASIPKEPNNACKLDQSIAPLVSGALISLPGLHDGLGSGIRSYGVALSVSVPID